MITSTAISISPKVERRVSTNGKCYRIEFKSYNNWVFYNTIYNTLNDAIDNMNKMNEYDDKLDGEWSVING